MTTLREVLYRPFSAPLILVASLTACGGSGGVESGPTLDAQAGQTFSSIEVDCINCGATSPTMFTPGSNAGVWMSTQEVPKQLSRWPSRDLVGRMSF